MRRPREELRQLMIDAGCELLDQHGLAFDPANLTYANAFAFIEETQGIRLHRSQVHGRIWDNQDHYRTDVAVAVIDRSAPGSAEVDELVKGLTAPDESRLVQSLVSQWVKASNDASREFADADLRFDLLVAAQALSAKDSATAPDIGAAVGANLRRRTAHNEQRYEQVATNLGAHPAAALGLDPADAWSILARASSALLEGARLFENVTPALSAPFTVTDAEGTPHSRDPASLGLCLIVEQLFGLAEAEADQESARSD